MDRKEFIKKVGALSLALTGLPLGKKVFATNTAIKIQGEPADEYRKNVDTDEDDYTIYVLKINNSAIVDFPSTSDENKRITLEIEKRDPKRVSNILGELKYEFYISSVQEDKEFYQWHVKTERAKRLSGTISWPDNLSKNPALIVRLMERAWVLDKNNSPLVTLGYVDEFEDCFITTACVAERGLADDCHELSTLRFLRENYMRNTKQGRYLLDEYEWLGPAVVTAIGQCGNRAEIYDYLYENMITPSVNMIEQGKYQDAVDWYEGFTMQLKTNFKIVNS